MTRAKFPKYEYFNVTSPADWVAHVEINRPKKLNAWIEPMWLELGKLFNALSINDAVRVIVLTGSGPRAFTTGLDTAAAFSGGALVPTPNLDPARKALSLRRHVYEFQSCITAVEKCEKPVICAMHGYAYGLGVDLSCCADVRFAAADTKFCVKEVDLGLAADIGTLTRLPKVVGRESWVKDICYSARVWGAEEAERVGYISKIGRDKEDTVRLALEWAEAVAAKSPVAVQGTKEQINYSRDHQVEEGLRYVSVWNSSMLQTNDVTESGKATVQKRKPTYEKL